MDEQGDEASPTVCVVGTSVVATVTAQTLAAAGWLEVTSAERLDAPTVAGDCVVVCHDPPTSDARTLLAGADLGTDENADQDGSDADSAGPSADTGTGDAGTAVTAPVVVSLADPSSGVAADVLDRGATDVYVRDDERERTDHGDTHPLVERVRTVCERVGGSGTAAESLRPALDHADVGLAAYDERGQVVAATDRFEALLGLDEATGASVWEVHPALTEAGFDDYWASVDAETTKRVEFERDDGTTVELATRAGSDRPTHHVVTAVDVTERTRYADEHRMLRAILEHIPVHLFVKDRDGRHIRVSYHYEDRDEEMDIIGKTDVEFYGEEQGRPDYEDDMRVVEEGERIENRLVHEERYDSYFLSTKVPWHDETGERAGVIGITREITALKRYQRHLERHNERLQTIADLIETEIHDPLDDAIDELVDRVATETAEEDEERETNEQIASALSALRRMRDLLEDLLAMARHGQWVEDREMVDAPSVARSSWEHAAPGDATLRVEDDWYVECDRTRLRQLFENLIRNAAVHGGPDVTVEIGPLDNWLGFYVEDDGPGIPEDERDSVFESGYTTDDRGTGFGLAIVEMIARAHDWDVTVDEGADGGARFEFTGRDVVHPTGSIEA